MNNSHPHHLSTPIFNNEPSESDVIFPSIVSSSRAFLAAESKKARNVTFYRNGRQFDHAVRVAFILGKTFPHLDALMDHLTEKCPDIPYGVRYIFSMTGKMVLRLNDLQHNQSYVMSGVKNFHFMNYGVYPEPTHNKVTSESSSSVMSYNGSSKSEPNRPTMGYSDFMKIKMGGSHGLDREFLSDTIGKVITLINGRNPAFKSRVILNLRTPKSFESVLKDLGESVQLPNPRSLFIESGKEIKSISQLRRELSYNDLFFLDVIVRSNGVVKQSSQSMEALAFNHQTEPFLENHLMTNYNFMNGISAEELTSSSVNHSSLLNNIRYEDSDSDPTSTINKQVTDTTLPTRIETRETSGNVQVRRSRSVEVNSVSSQTSKPSTPHPRQQQEEETQTSLVSLRNPLENETNTIQEEEARGTDSEEIKEPPTTDADVANDADGDGDGRDDDIQGEKKTRNTDTFDVSLSMDSVELHRKLHKAYRTFNHGVSIIEEEVQRTPPIASSEIEVQKPQNNQTLSKSVVKSLSLKSESSTEEPETEVAGSQKSLPNNLRSSPQNRRTNLAERQSGANMPDKTFSLHRILGYRSEATNGNLACLKSGSLAYAMGGIAVIWDPNSGGQRFYCEHKRDIEGIACHDGTTLATVEASFNKESDHRVHVRIWSSESLETYNSFEEPLNDSRLMGIFFAPNGMLLLIRGNQETVLGRICDWKDKKRVKIVTCFTHEMLPEESIVAGIFHPRDEDILVTFGRQHLILWQLKTDKTDIDRKTFLSCYMKSAKGSKISVSSAAFLSDDTLLSANSSGELTIWAPVPGEDGNLDFMQRVFPGHNSAISALCPLIDSLVVSADFTGGVKLWKIEDGSFDLLATHNLPDASAAILTVDAVPSQSEEAYILTGHDQVIRCLFSRTPALDVVLEGNSFSEGFLCLATHPHDKVFFTACSDNSICKWDAVKGLEWKTTLRTQGISVSCHPSGGVVAVGCRTGHVVILAASEGLQLSLLPISESSISSLSYSSNGEMLACASSEGMMYLLPVTDDGLAYRSLSVLKCAHPLVSIQWSEDNQYIMTSVDNNGNPDLVLWDLPNSRFMQGFDAVPEDIVWRDPIWSRSEKLRGIYENELIGSLLSLNGSCSHSRKYMVCGDDEGVIRLFSYPCRDKRSGFFYHRQGSSGVTDVHFLSMDDYFVTANCHGEVFVWKMEGDVRSQVSLRQRT